LFGHKEALVSARGAAEIVIECRMENIPCAGVSRHGAVVIPRRSIEEGRGLEDIDRPRDLWPVGIDKLIAGVLTNKSGFKTNPLFK
jgi:hypothetical protein